MRCPVLCRWFEGGVSADVAADVVAICGRADTTTVLASAIYSRMVNDMIENAHHNSAVVRPGLAGTDARVHLVSLDVLTGRLLP